MINLKILKHSYTKAHKNKNKLAWIASAAVKVSKSNAPFLLRYLCCKQPDVNFTCMCVTTNVTLIVMDNFAESKEDFSLFTKYLTYIQICCFTSLQAWTAQCLLYLSLQQLINTKTLPETTGGLTRSVISSWKWRRWTTSPVSLLKISVCLLVNH